MITHSFIVSALLAVSLSAQAGAIAMDGISIEANPADAGTTSSAVLHRDVGLRQGGGNGKDVTEAPTTEGQCAASPGCTIIPRVETLQDLLVVNRNASGLGPFILLLLFVLTAIVVLFRRSPSTK